MATLEHRTEPAECSCCRLCTLEPVHSNTDEHLVDSAPHQHSHEEAGGHDHGGQDHADHETIFRQRFWVSLLVTVPVLFWSSTIQGWFGYTAAEFTGSWLIVPVLATFIFFYGGAPFLRMAGWELRAKKPAMMTLISLAIVVAYFFSMATLVWDLGEDFFWELVTLIDIMLLGHWMEMRSVRQASGALDALSKLLPDIADVVSGDGSIESRPADQLRADDVVLVRPGARVPADGAVAEGSSEVNEAMITGESKPVSKDPADDVIAGTVNSGSGSLRVKVTAVGDDTTLAGIMKLVADAQASKSPTQLVADRAASFLFYAAVASAALTGIVWTAVDGGFETETIARVVTVLVIACPHALGLAIPLVIANTTDIAARNGTLIRNREAIDTAKDLNIIAFDKTGTLTAGEIGVTGLATTDGLSKVEILSLAAAVEGDSEHPLATAIRQAGHQPTPQPAIPEVTDFQIIKGQGAQAKVGNDLVAIGGPRLIESRAISLPDQLETFTTTSGEKGETVIYLIRGHEAIGAIALADVIREESRTAISALHDMNVEVAMLTGDSHDVAAAVADELGIDRYFSQVLPEDKEEHIRDLQSKGKSVGMVGDGVNDAPALTRANIGIAIGSGTDVAVQSADLVLVKNNPLDVPRILKLSAASYRKQVENIWWGAGYNVVMIPLAAGVLAPWGLLMPPAVGAVFMSLSTIVVAINAQLLRRVDLSVG